MTGLARWRVVVGSLILLFLGTLWVRANRPDEERDSELLDSFVVASIDDDANGIVEEYKVTLRGNIVLHLRDGNQDGHLDEWLFYESGSEKALVGDHNYDGKPEVYMVWTGEGVGVTASDLDGNGIVDKKDWFYTIERWRP